MNASEPADPVDGLLEAKAERLAGIGRCCGCARWPRAWAAALQPLADEVAQRLLAHLAAGPGRWAGPPLRTRLQQAAAQHWQAAWPQVTGGDFVATHWPLSFARLR